MLTKVSNKMGMPMLLAFIILGMLFGSDGIFKIPFDNSIIMEQIATIALIFIIFYGGFGTKWTTAKPVVVKAVVLSTLGVILTALFVGLFCYYILKLPILISFLIGSVISSTDAASVFSILRSKKLNLKDGTAPLLEFESGSIVVYIDENGEKTIDVKGLVCKDCNFDDYPNFTISFSAIMDEGYGIKNKIVIMDLDGKKKYVHYGLIDISVG